MDIEQLKIDVDFMIQALKEAEAARWLAGSELQGVAWLPADMELIEHIIAALG